MGFGMPSSHPSEDRLELFVLARLEPCDSKSIEEHVKVCPMCAERLDEIRKYVDAMRAALRKLANEEKL